VNRLHGGENSQARFGLSKVPFSARKVTNSKCMKDYKGKWFLVRLNGSQLYLMSNYSQPFHWLQVLSLTTLRWRFMETLNIIWPGPKIVGQLRSVNRHSSSSYEENCPKGRPLNVLKTSQRFCREKRVDIFEVKVNCHHYTKVSKRIPDLLLLQTLGLFIPT